MRHALILLALILSLAGSACGGVQQQEAANPQVGLDRLFARLQNANDLEEAELIETAIRSVWSNSGRPVVDAIMIHGAEAMEMERFDDAEALFARAIELAPDFVEGWNMRALARYMKDDYSGAVQDLSQVLVREPRHFGALVGLGEILVELDREESALRVFEYALKVNPHLAEAQAEIRKIRRRQLGSTI